MSCHDWSFHGNSLRTFLSVVTKRCNPSIWSMLHFSLIHLSSRVYSPGNSVLPSDFVPGFIHLIRVNPTSAAFSLITAYSIRHRIIVEHPHTFNHLFPWLPLPNPDYHGIGEFATPSSSPQRLMMINRGPVRIEPNHSSKAPRPFPLGSPTRRTCRRENR